MMTLSANLSKTDCLEITQTKIMYWLTIQLIFELILSLPILFSFSSHPQIFHYPKIVLMTNKAPMNRSSIILPDVKILC